MHNATIAPTCPENGQWGSSQPFGSMPRCCNSLRSMRFIQVASDESPSLRISSSSWVRNSSGSRIWYCGDFFSSCIDTCNYPYYYLLCVITRVITFILNSNAPRVSLPHAGRLTNNVKETNAMATPQCNQTRPKFQYRFMALDRADCQAKPCKIIIEATSEHEARKVLAPRYMLSLSAVLPVSGVHHV